MSQGIPPWQMWGSTQTVNVPGKGSVVKVPQLSSLVFDRPNTFSFFFFAQILGIAGVLPGNAMRVAVRINFGLGRDTATFENFAVLEWTAAEIVIPNEPRVCSSVELAPNRVGRVSPNVIEWLPAQQIQVDADAFFEGSVPGNTSQVKVLVGAYIAPFTHVRADWFAKQAAPGPVPSVAMPHPSDHHLFERSR